MCGEYVFQKAMDLPREKLWNERENEWCFYDHAYDCCMEGICTMRWSYTNGERMFLLYPSHCCHVETILAIRNSLRKFFGSETFFLLTFRHRASCILGQAFHYSPENLFIYLINKYISLSGICLTVHHWYK